MILQAWQQAMITAACAAGRAIMPFFCKDPRKWEKPDRSPVTQADLAAQEGICAILRDFADFAPILSEEMSEEDNTKALQKRYFCVDPLDGTREFIAQRPDFCVNIALIEGGRPLFGVIALPAFSLVLGGGSTWGCGQWGLDQDGSLLCATPQRLDAQEGKYTGKALMSKQDAKQESLHRLVGKREHVHLGSARKFCLLAQKKADMYVRRAPAMIWDIAAGQAIVEGAGGRLCKRDLVSPLLYPERVSPDAMRVGSGFVAWAKTPDA